MEAARKTLDYIGYINTFILLSILLMGIVTWVKGIFPALLRLGNGLAKRKIAIFAKGDNLNSLKKLLLDSRLFGEKNLIEVTSKNDFGRAEQATLYLVFWHDWQDEIDVILKQKVDSTALVIYAPQALGFIPKESMSKLGEKRNTAITNFRGRLLNDIVSSMITTSYEKE